MEYAIATVWMIIEVACLYYICKSFLKPKATKNRTYYVLLGEVATALLLNNLNIPVLIEYSILRKLLMLGICIVASLLIFDGKWYIHVFAVGVYYCLLGTMDTVTVYGMAMLLGIRLEELVWRKWLYTLIVLAGKCISLFVSWLFCAAMNKRVPENLIKNTKSFSVVCLFPLLSIFMLYIVFDSYKLQPDLSVAAVIFSVILIIANIAVINLIVNMERTAKAERDVAILTQSMAIQADNIRSLEKSYRDQRTATHDFKHQLQVISGLIEQGKIIEANEYISNLQATHTSRILAADTKHPYVDAVLNAKYQAAKAKKIDIRYKVNDLSNLSVETDALVVLLSNLLDNAIEACERLESGRVIECTILMSDKLLISVRNTSPPVDIIDGEIRTTKASAKEHGFGLNSVKRIIQQFDGEFAMEYSDGWFQFTTDIPLNN